MKTVRVILIVAVAMLAADAFAQRTDERDVRRAKKYLEEDPDYLKKLPKVIWRRPMGPYVKDVWSGYRGGPGPAKMIAKRTGHRLTIVGGNFLFVWDDRRGGELSEVFLFDGGTWKHVNCTMAYLGRDTIPRYAIQRQKDFHGNAPTYYLNQAIGTKIDLTRNDAERVDFTTVNRMVTTNRDPGPWTVRQRYRVYPQGVIVCDFEIALDAAAGSFTIRHAQMGAYLEDILFKEIYTIYPVHFRWGTADYGAALRSEPNWKALGEDRLVPMGSATFGVSRRADFTNRFEFWLERPRPLLPRGAKPRTEFAMFSSGLWYEPSDMSTRPNCGREFRWELFRGDPAVIKPPFVYRNRWTLAVGGPRVVAEGPVSRRNNLLASRIVHWQAPDPGDANARLPSDAQLLTLSDQGANVLVLSPGWAREDAPTTPRDAARLAACIRKAHGLGMRVVPAVPLSAAEKAEGLFGDILSANRDGLMVYGLGSATMAPGVDLAARIERLARLRKCVGEGGVLIGASENGLPTQIEMAFMDTVTPGPALTTRLFSSPDRLITCGGTVGCGLSPLVTRSDRRVPPVLAAATVSPQLVTGPDLKNETLLPIWRLLARLDAPVLHALSPRLEDQPAFRVEPRTLPAVAYLTKTQALLVVASPSARKGCRITVAAGLGVGPGAAGKLLTLAGDRWRETPFTMRAGVIDIPALAAGEIRAYAFPRARALP